MWILLLLFIVALGMLLLLNTPKKKDHTRNVYTDYELFLHAASTYKDTNGSYTKLKTDLKPFISDLTVLDAPSYSLSLDGKFLLVAGLSQDEMVDIVNVVGGDSYVNGKYAYLTLRRFNELSKVKPTAHFTTRPDSKISTTTKVVYDISGCVAEDNEILSKKWENNLNHFRDGGKYVISLSIQDKHGNWSDTFSKEVYVTEEQGIKQIESYDNTFFVVYNNGKSLSKGTNEYGQLGNGTLTPIPDLKYDYLHDGIVEVACGEGFTLFLNFDGVVYASGDNKVGQLGVGDRSPSKSLKEIWGISDIKQISVGRKFAAALSLQGEVYVWGDNSEYQISSEGSEDYITPIILKNAENIKEISCGSTFGLALKYDGTVVSWGSNTHGQLGLGYKGSIAEPYVSLFKGVKSVHAGDKFSLVLLDSGKVFGCGANNLGQLGAKGSNEVLFPVEAMKIKDIDKLYVKDSLVLAVSKTGKAFVWGLFGTPNSKPIFEPMELPGIHYIKCCGNDGKKLYIVDNNDMLYIVSDTTGRYERKKLHNNIKEFISESKN